MKRFSLIVIILAIVLTGPAMAGDWKDNVKVSGDFRHRFEQIDIPDDDYDRLRQRIRARLGLDAEINEDWSAHFRLTSGSDDPVSGNQTLDEGFSTKPFGLDKAYFKYAPAYAEGLAVMGGKMGNPFIRMEKTELIWDGDLSFEGAALKLSRDLNEKAVIHLVGGGFCVEERKSDDESRLFGGQAGFTVKAGEKVSATFGGGYFGYTEIKGREGIYDSGDFFGNSTGQFEVTPGNFITGYANDFKLFEAFGQISMKINKLSWKVFGDFVTNNEADEDNQGWLFGTSVKKGKGLGSFKLALNYRRLEKDAVLGVFTDSDVFGGGTNGKGLELGAGLGLGDHADLAFTAFVDKNDLDDEYDYNRYQLDIKVKF